MDLTYGCRGAAPTARNAATPTAAISLLTPLSLRADAQHGLLIVCPSPNRTHRADEHSLIGRLYATETPSERSSSERPRRLRALLEGGPSVTTGSCPRWTAQSKVPAPKFS